MLHHHQNNNHLNGDHTPRRGTRDHHSPLGKSLSEHTDVYEHLYSQDKPIHMTFYRNGDQFNVGVPVIVTRN